MEGYKKRLILEEDELVDRIDKLTSFMCSDKYFNLPFMKKWKLRRQYTVMNRLCDILDDRIQLEGITEEECSKVITLNKYSLADSEFKLNKYDELEGECKELKILIEKKDTIIIDQNVTISHLKKDIEEYKAAISKLTEEKPVVKVKSKRVKKNVENKEN